MIQGLLLAAGKSERFGAQKLLKKLPSHDPVAVASFNNLNKVTDSAVAIVSPADSDLIRLLSERKIRMCSCPESSLGMGHSIACGVAHTKDADGWLIGLADMPFIQISTIKSIVNLLNFGALIAVPVYGGRRGHPVGFSKKLYAELIALEGDVGARILLKKYSSEVVERQCGDPGIHADIDTLEDLEKYAKQFLTGTP
jgi:molybdenum cofactor cytidylyltransferase